MIEPWLRGTLTDVDPILRQVLHALELAGEDAARWCTPLTDAEINARPFRIAPVAFHLRHIGHSLDRLLTYAEGRQLSPAQLESLSRELLPEASTESVLSAFTTHLETASTRISTIDPDLFQAPREVGRQRLPTTVGGLLVHCAEHTQRHIGQAVTTAQIVERMRSA